MKKAKWLVALAAASMLTLTACSAEAGTEPDAGNGDAGGTVDVAEYQAVAEEALKPVEGFTGPTEGPAAYEGAKVMVIACGFAAEGCKGPADAAPEAGEALGWDVTVIDGQFDPQIYNRSISQAIDQDYDAIIIGSISDSAISESLKQAREAGIIVGSWDSANEPSETGVSFEVDQPIAQQGTNVGSYLVWKSEGDLNLHLLLNPEFNVVMGWSEAVRDVVEDCASCTLVREDNFTADDAANRLPTLVTQALRQNPEINAVSGGYDAAMLSTIPSLESAELADQVMIAGFNGIPPFIEFIREGRAAVTSAVPIKWGMWAAFDNVNRLLNGEDIVEQNLPTRLIAEENIDDIPANSQWEGDVDYKSEFIRIWSGE